ncbi:ABC transporter ATP-binding protein [Nonomuraea soli]|uniref:Multiple sugar transport system ATP-binding protein n=1 Tax=Nonomuraea soli TaxID=1032476 RepID=A0A7W0CUC9_9ACTN|nr:sn-glycerol-3-phosphate ABC transporter ATP-binding protein UgpC [Nonomuraea soli]MBA2897348.1 multiple sugar transport system ATP-binding protein [Nonomuraea soli]
MAEIVLNGVTKRYADGTLAVDHFDLDIADHEFIILVGPSGCGKSTTLNMIAGLEDISSGDLLIDGERVNDKAPRDRDIAMVFQSYALYPHMTVGENIAFPLKLAKVPAADITKRVQEAASMLDLTPYLDRKPANLSGGQRQRVAMGRAIVRSPKAFLMDEPLSNLDAKLRVQMRTTISRLQKNLGTTTIYVTHDQTEAMTLGDRIVLMRSGLVQQIGPPQELYDHPRNLFVAGFIGSPAMNFLPATVTPEALRTDAGDIPYGTRLRRALADHDVPPEVIVGIRPEAFQTEEVPGGASFTDTVDIVESLGAEKLAYFSLSVGAITSDHLADTAAFDADGQPQIVARLDPACDPREGRELTIWFSPDDVHLFDPSSGANLTEQNA